MLAKSISQRPECQLLGLQTAGRAYKLFKSEKLDVDLARGATCDLQVDGAD